MTETRATIELRGGVRVNLLFTPSLSKYAEAHGFTLKGNPNDMRDVARVYTEILYCGAENAWNVDKVNNPEKGDFSLDFADFSELPITNPVGFAKASKTAFEAIMQRGLKETAQAKAEHEKKNDSEFCLYVDYTPIEKFLIGRCGKTDLQARLTSYEEYLYLLEGKMEENRLAWVVARWGAWWQTILSPNIPQGSKPKRPEDIMLFEWEQEAEEKRLKEQLESTKVSTETQEALNRLFKNVTE